MPAGFAAERNRPTPDNDSRTPGRLAVTLVIASGLTLTGACGGPLAPSPATLPPPATPSTSATAPPAPTTGAPTTAPGTGAPTTAPPPAPPPPGVL